MAKPKPVRRSILLVRAPDEIGVGVFRLTVDKETHFYTFREIRCEIGGRGFEVHKLGLGDKYHVRVGKPANCSCECMGFLVHDTCKHVLGLKALVRLKQV